MCGICGIIRFDNQPVQEAPIREMMRIMKHRGPDDEGIFIKDNIGLGFVRLSIIDLSPAGNQPMFSHDERYVIVYNGEIFNYLELRDELKSLGHSFKTSSDTEVLLAAYFEWGEECLHKFNGMWAFVIYDRRTKSIFASRDRYGIKPFYYYSDDKILAFASEIPPLLTLLPGKPTPDYQSIFDYLVFNRTDHTARTFFEEIRKLQHGCILKIDDLRLMNDINNQQSTINNQQSEFGDWRLKIERWYDLKTRVKKVDGFKDPSEFKELFSSAVGLRLRSDVPVGICLSGGLDSSSIVSVLLKDFNLKDINTFSAVYKEGMHGDESEYIKLYSSQLKNMFYTWPDAESLYEDLTDFIRNQAEPVPATGVYAQFKVMELAKKHVVVTLDGQGSDEIFAGYHYFFGYFFKGLLRKGKTGTLIKEIFWYLKEHNSLYGLKTFIYFLLPVKNKTGIRIKKGGYFENQFIQSYSRSNRIADTLYAAGSMQDALIDHFEYKLEHLLKWEDHNSMWFSVEARVPFLDHRLVEKTLACTGEQIIKNGMTKHLLREAMIEILPEKIRLRKDKIGFGTPQDTWLTESVFRMLTMNILTSSSFRNRGIIDVEKAKELYSKHLNGKINISKEIWKWINLELWFREFID